MILGPTIHLLSHPRREQVCAASRLRKCHHLSLAEQKTILAMLTDYKLHDIASSPYFADVLWATVEGTNQTRPTGEF